MDRQRVAQRILSGTWVAALGLGALLAAPAGAQTTWHVPGDVPTIQGALALASDGDVIEVQPGTYPEALDTLGKSVTLRGPGGAEVTVVDATGLAKPTVTISDGSPLIEELTITGGHGGVVTTFGTPTLRACTIRDNTTTEFESGGGVLGKLDSVVTLENCTLRGNSAGAGGGAAYEVLLKDCVVEDNEAGSGGGLFGVIGATNCVIRGNTATHNGGGVVGALDKISHCVIQGNVAGGKGGGMYGTALVPTIGGAMPPLADVSLLQNTAITGGGLYYELAQPQLAVQCSLTRVLIADNVANSANDGAYISASAGFGGGDVLVENCTFGTDRLYVLAAHLNVTNSIFWGLTGMIQCQCFGPAIDVSYSDVKGGVPGTGNMNADPLFADPATGDYALQPGSPCINKGDPTAPHDPDGSVVDMGAVPYDAWTDLGFALAGTQGEPVLTGSGPLTWSSSNTLELTNAPPSVAATLVVGQSQLGAAFKGGVMVPSLDALFLGLATGPEGSLTLPFTWPAGTPPAFSVYLQFWLPDPAGPKGFAASNGLQATTP